MTKTLQIKPHTRRAPVDPDAEAKERMTRLLNEYVILRDLERELSQAFEDEFGRQYANYLREVR
ncbi:MULTISPECIES: hypothetical protein [Chelativorans]|jgi:hypothetical protein|uniref:hypothetical protein n=1 Tax=Chelativorans TaxID=449972 RepID=UPI00003A3661|nr:MULTISPECIES: hypothetical protein [Chelativorans]